MAAFYLDRPNPLLAHGMKERDARRVLAALSAGGTAEHCGRPLHDGRNEGEGWICSRALDGKCAAWVQTSPKWADLHPARRLTT
jgi:hypothetical protein